MYYDKIKSKSEPMVKVEEPRSYSASLVEPPSGSDLQPSKTHYYEQKKA
jgi:hypothetical protein